MCHEVSPACRCQDSRDRAAMASSSGPSRTPAAAHIPVSVAGETSAPCRAREVTRQFWLPPSHIPLGQQHRDELVAEKALADRLGRAGRRHRRRDPARAGPPVPAPAVRRHPHRHLPVQQIRNMIAQPRERRPALRAPVPAAGKVPDHPGPGQMRVIAPPRPGPRPPGPAVTAAPAAPARGPAAVLTPGRPRPRPLRRPPEHQPLQHRQLSGHPLELSIAARQLLPQPRVLRPQLLRHPRQPLVRLQRRCQHIPQRRVSTRLRDHASPGSHEAQQTPRTTPKPRDHPQRA
jgi:hypothetical protein